MGRGCDSRRGVRTTGQPRAGLPAPGPTSRLTPEQAGDLCELKASLRTSRFTAQSRFLPRCWTNAPLPPHDLFCSVEASAHLLVRPASPLSSTRGGGAPTRPPRPRAALSGGR